MQRSEDSSEYFMHNETKCTEFVFVNGEETKRELDLFMNGLIGESFTISYYKEIFIYQFIRILAGFINKIIALRSYTHSEIQFLPPCHINDLHKLELNETQKVKIIFLPNIKIK